MTLTPRRPRVPLPIAAIAGTAVLTVLATLAGQHDWALPERVLGGWQVAAVPASLTVLVLLSAVVCVAVGARTTLRDSGLRPRDPAFLAWLFLVVVAAAALVWNALVLAADAAFVVGALIPVLHWAFTFVPALLAGLVARKHRPATTLAVSLGTGVVTVPLLALGFSLFDSRGPVAVGVLSSLWSTALLGVLPLAFAALIAKNLSSNREHSVA
jgi:hypothetical protein